MFIDLKSENLLKQVKQIPLSAGLSFFISFSNETLATKLYESLRITHYK